MAKQKEAVEAKVVQEPGYDKQQLLASQKYCNRRDLIGALLVDGKSYTIQEVDALIADFDKKEM